MPRAPAAFLLGLLASSCGSRPSVAIPRAPVAETAVVATTAAAVLYVAAGGCKIAGCPGALACNPATERCEELPCAAGCPAGSRCDASDDRCVPVR